MKYELWTIAQKNKLYRLIDTTIKLRKHVGSEFNMMHSELKASHIRVLRMEHLYRAKISYILYSSSLHQLFRS